MLQPYVKLYPPSAFTICIIKNKSLVPMVLYHPNTHYFLVKKVFVHQVDTLLPTLRWRLPLDLPPFRFFDSLTPLINLYLCYLSFIIRRYWLRLIEAYAGRSKD